MDDVCVCCKECAKLDGQSCGGRFNKYGQCDNGLVCELIVAVGDSLSSDAQGICRGNLVKKSFPPPFFFAFKFQQCYPVMFHFIHQNVTDHNGNAFCIYS